ncbi:hypothetical protein [Microbulbifer sp. HZ11]|uniref:hypothetical protein n=1 Tax=unclassified Microbulbifer TaxID=2619833 RepID=UPI0012DC4648|nr:hypothetical protein [Microbulbifer sp. HZ11]
MLDFIKYSRFKFRDYRKPCVPKGPNFSSAKTYKYRLQGSAISFKAPKQIHLFRPNSEQFTSNWKDDDLRDLKITEIDTFNDSWASSTILTRKYALFGPWFTGELARADLFLAAICPAKEPKNLNFLHPRAFETAISGYLTADYGCMKSEDGSADFKGPLGWEPIRGFPVPAARFSVESECWDSRNILFCFPVSSNRILMFHFSFDQSAAGTFEEVDAIISPEPAQNLIENIINSIEFSPSPELEKELAELRKTCPDLSVSKDFPPLKWPATVDETGLNIVELNAERRKALAG